MLMHQFIKIMSVLCTLLKFYVITLNLHQHINILFTKYYYYLFEINHINAGKKYSLGDIRVSQMEKMVHA